MRRSLVLTLVCAFVVTALPAASSPGAGGGAEQWADAAWIVGKGDRPHFYFAIGARFADPYAGVMTLGGVGKGRCRRSRHGIWCSGQGVAAEIPFEDFSMDPAMDSATMKVKLRGVVHRASWTGRGDVPVFQQGAYISPRDVAAGAALARSARASGRLFGQQVNRRTARVAFGFMATVAGAGVFLDSRDVRIRPDGTVLYRVTVTD